MMRIVLYTVIALVCYNGSFAQSSNKFGRFTAKDIEMKECSFDPEASAVVLLNEGSADYNDEYNLIAFNHKRIKILKEEGIKQADISIPYYSDGQFEYIDDIVAITYNFDEKGELHESRVDKKNIYFRKVNNYYSEVSFAFPQARVGSIIEYSYRSVMKNYGGLEDWYFQSSLPVCVSSFQLKPAPNLEFTYRVQKREDYQVKIKPSEFNSQIIFEMKDIPGLSQEPYMDAREDYIQKINFQITKFMGMVGAQKYMTSWNEVARELSGHMDFGAHLRSNIPDEMNTFLASLSGKSDFDKMKSIHNYTRNNLQWDKTKGIYSSTGMKALWSKKTGNSSAINLALVNFLKEAKLEAYPMIVSERGNGKINTQTPFVKQFNNTYAAVIIDGKPYYLDATDRLTPCYLIPPGILNTTALIIKSKSGTLTEIKEEHLKYQDNIFINSILTDDGRISGEVQLMSKDYARTEHIRYYKEDEKDYIENHLKKGWVNLHIDSLEVLNLKEDTLAFDQKFKYTTGIQNSGEYAFLNTNMFTGFEANPFIINNRFSNINFGYKRSLVLNYILQLPPTITIDALPKGIKLVNADRTVVFSRETFFSPESLKLIVRIKVDLNKSQYSVDEYADLKEFYKKMIDLMNEQIVLKRK